MGRSSSRADVNGVLTLGDGVGSFGDVNGTDQTAFTRAVTECGGRLTVLPGVYTFTAGVALPHGGVRIEFLPGARMIPAASGALGLFSFSGDDVFLDGLHVVATAPAANQNAVLLTGNRVKVLNPIVEILGDAAGFIGLHLGPTSGAATPQGCVVRDGEFVFAATVPNVTGMKVRNYQGLRVHGNEFSPAVGVTTAQCKYGIELDSAGWGSLQGNVFQSLGSEAAPITAAIYSNAESEGAHLAVNGNSFEVVNASGAAIHWKGGRFTPITGNMFGRCTLNAMPCIHLDVSVGNVAGEGCLVVGNQFHNCGGAEGAANPGVVRVTKHVGTLIEGNQFTRAHVRQIVIATSASETGVHFNHAVADSSGLTAPIASFISFLKASNDGYSSWGNVANAAGAQGWTAVVDDGAGGTAFANVFPAHTHSGVTVGAGATGAVVAGTPDQGMNVAF